MSEKLFETPVLVLHVREGYENRAIHITKMLGKRRIPFKFILDGDIADITQEILEKYFVGQMYDVSAQTSCALKHIYAYEYILENNLNGALILEDDIMLYPRFEKVFDKCMHERKRRNISECLISFEDSSLKFVKGSMRRKGQYLYFGERDRFTGCYYISASCARHILDYIKSSKCDYPIDLFHTQLMSRIKLPYYWSHPTLATQGTSCGNYASSISKSSLCLRLYRKITWYIKRLYKMFLYKLR